MAQTVISERTHLSLFVVIKLDGVTERKYCTMCTVYLYIYLLCKHF